MTTPLLSTQCTLIVSGLPNLNLEDLTGAPVPYQLEASTREEYALTWRKQEATSPFVEGTYQISAVRENVVENVAVWVRGANHSQMDRRVQEILLRVERPSFEVDFMVGAVTERWRCSSAQYTVRTQREYLHATMALVKLQLPRLPRVTRTYSDGQVVTR